MNKKAKKKAAKGAPQKKARTLYIAAGATGYIVHPGKPLPPDLQKIVEARARVIAEDMVAEAKAGGTIIYLHAKKRAYKIADGEPLPAEIQELVNDRAKKLADEMAKKQEEMRRNTMAAGPAPTVTEVGRHLAQQIVSGWSPGQQNMILAMIVQRLQQERKSDVHQMERMQKDAGEQLHQLYKSLEEVQKIVSGEFLILH